MPQLVKGGKYVFGWSLINDDLKVKIPGKALREYHLNECKKVILFSGSKKTGGFCVSSRDWIEKTIIKGIFEQNPGFNNPKTCEGEFVKYKSRFYCWADLKRNLLYLTPEMLKTFGLKPNDRLLSIRGSYIAFVMGAKGPIIDTANKSVKYIREY
ncbi:MAG: hypothetical protein RBR81_02795 [Bacteroidales bacterium]|nr:hypothetical protein [Bacteroidales bacterium]